MKSQSSWDAVVRHARECDLRGSQLKSYKVESENENVTLFFNCVDDLVGAAFHDGFVAKDKFGERQKVRIAVSSSVVATIGLGLQLPRS